MIRGASRLSLLAGVLFAAAGPGLAPTLDAQGAPPQVLLRLDDVGMNHSVNAAIERFAATGIPFSASVLFVGPAWREAVEILKRHPQVSVGVHLALNAEWRGYRWGPVLGKAGVPSLVGPDGSFLPSGEGFLASRYELAEVEREMEAQVQRALSSGLRITYVDAHMGTLQATPELRAIQERVARRHGLAISRHFGESYFTLWGVAPDAKRPTLLARLGAAKRDTVNLVVAHVAERTPEMEALFDMNAPEQNAGAGVAAHRGAELDALLSPELAELARSGKLRFITYDTLVARVGARESTRILKLEPGITATIVAPEKLTSDQRVDLIFYALPNGNSTAETMGKMVADSAAWRYDIQHIAAQTRALRTMGLPQAVVVYLEAQGKSWPAWRRTIGYDSANARVVRLIQEVIDSVGRPPVLSVTLAGHSGGGSLMFGFIEGQGAVPDWIERIAFLDASYNFDARHGAKLTEWLRRNPRHVLVSIAYDDREIMLDGKKVVSDSGGTWRATERMLAALRPSFPLAADTLGEFARYRSPQIEILRHPNPQNRILHTEMIGEMNGYMHALLVRRPGYETGPSVLGPARAYTAWIAR
jgi:chitin disaccharide deacetylase